MRNPSKDSEPNPRTEGAEPKARTTSIPGLLLVDLPLHTDGRGWFKENWQREKMIAVGLPDFEPVQNNISLNLDVGTTRGIHAEPWDKYVSVAAGRVFGAWVDLRAGSTFGAVFTTEFDPSTAIFVPRGVGNAYQTLQPQTVYTYLVNDHWSADAEYAFLNLADETVAIEWPIPLSQGQISAKDRAHPSITRVTPVAQRKTLVLGAAGQVGSALRDLLGEQPHIEFATRRDIDVVDADISSLRRWKEYDTIINAAAYTAVDKAETVNGRRAAWAVNAAATARVAQVAAEHGITLVHFSSDYVFDGSAGRAYEEDDPFSPLGVYGQTKAAGDLVVAATSRHYILRTSWVVGDGDNFVRTMQSLAERGGRPKVVNDQVGRLTFAADIARAVKHLLEVQAPFGTYNLSSTGSVRSWADIARDVYRLTGHDPARVADVTTRQYDLDAVGPVAPRPPSSVLALEKIASTGFTIRHGSEALEEYLNS